jgi:hypothetical protein
MAMSVPPEPEFLRNLNDDKITRRFAPLPPGYDAIRADDTLLDDLGFPPRPDDPAEHELRALWLEMFSAPLYRLEFSFVLYPPEGNALRTGRVGRRGGRQSSLNWSGASVVARNGQMFTDVVGAWRVPTVSVPAIVPVGVTDFRSSTWIGLDGQCGYLNSTLPQIGTAQRVTRVGAVDTVTTYCWLEWYPEIKEVTIPGLTVNAGNRMAAWVRVIPGFPPGAPMAVRMLIVNLSISPKPYAVFQVPVPAISWPPGSAVKLQPKVAGATAEWVMERPTNPDTHLPRELPHFTPVEFDPCFALTAPDPSGPRRLARFAGVNLIQMFRRENTLRRGTRVLAKAKRTGRNTFRVAPRVP